MKQIARYEIFPLEGKLLLMLSFLRLHDEPTEQQHNKQKTHLVFAESGEFRAVNLVKVAA